MLRKLFVNIAKPIFSESLNPFKTGVLNSSHGINNKIPKTFDNMNFLKNDLEQFIPKTALVVPAESKKEIVNAAENQLDKEKFFTPDFFNFKNSGFNSQTANVIKELQAGQKSFPKKPLPIQNKVLFPGVKKSDGLKSIAKDVEVVKKSLEKKIANLKDDVIRSIDGKTKSEKDLIEFLQKINTKVDTLAADHQKFKEILENLAKEKKVNKKAFGELLDKVDVSIFKAEDLAGKVVTSSLENQEQMQKIVDEKKNNKLEKLATIVTFLSAIAGVLFFIYQEKEVREINAEQKIKDAKATKLKALQIENEIKKLKSERSILEKQDDDIIENIGKLEQKISTLQEKIKSSWFKDKDSQMIKILEKELDNKNLKRKFIAEKIKELDEHIDQQIDFGKEHHQMMKQEINYEDDDRFEARHSMNRPF